MTRSTQTACVITAMALWIAGPETSLAHGYLVRSFPAAKSHLTRSPRHIDLLFSLMMDPNYSVVQLQDERGTVLATKTQTQRSRQFSMDAPVLQPGRYQVVYRMLAPDGDLLQGRVDFAVD
jgi:copper resistance protein C